jgi:molybdopterin/thiamine biosynthesis adenylyltransferase
MRPLSLSWIGAFLITPDSIPRKPAEPRGFFAMDQNETELEIDRILIVGVGGLGVPAALTLGRAASAMVVGLIDPENVELSNLPRQIVYRTADVGQPKVTAAARALVEDFPELMVETMPFRLEPENAADIVSEYHFVIDGADDPATKFLLNDSCLAAGRPFVYAGVLGFSGQAMTVLPGRTACLRCLFEQPPGDQDALGCRDAGIIGPVAGAIGSLQAQEGIAFLSGETPRLAGKILTYDALATPRTRLIEVAPRPQCSCGAAAHAVLDQPGSQPRKTL